MNRIRARTSPYFWTLSNVDGFSKFFHYLVNVSIQKLTVIFHKEMAAKCLKCGVILNDYCTVNLQWSVPVIEVWISISIWWSYDKWVFGPPCTHIHVAWRWARHCDISCYKGGILPLVLLRSYVDISAFHFPLSWCIVCLLTNAPRRAVRA